MARKPITYERLIKRDRKHKTFRFFFTLVLLIAGILFIKHVDSRLGEYEIAQPSNVVKEFLSTFEEKGAFPSSPFVSEETIASLSAVFSGRTLTFKEVIQPNKDELHYNLMAGSEVVALLKLKERLPVEGEHFNRWEIMSVDQVFSSERLALNLLKDFQNGDFSYILDNTDSSLYSAETVSDLSAYLLTATEGKDFSLSEGDASSEEKEYIYLLDGQPIFTVFAKSDASNRNMWRFTGSEAHFIDPTVYIAAIPADLTLYVNNAPAQDSWIKSTSQSAHASHVAEDVVNPVDLSIRHYEMPFAFTVPVFSLKDSLGNEHPFTLEGSQLIPASSATSILPEFSFLEANIKDATEKIARFFVGKVDLGTILRYVERDSDAYAVFYEYDLWKSLNAGSTETESFEIKSMTKLGDNCFVVEIESLFRASYTANNVIHYPLNYTLYYHLKGERWIIYDFISK